MTALRLLQNEKIRKTASENDNEALRLAARNGHIAVVLELLKIKSVHDNAASLITWLFVMQLFMVITQLCLNY